MGWTQQILTILEYIGIAAFAFSGAMVAIRRQLDIFGIVVLGVVTAVGGGALRDVLLGITPPVMFQNGIYVLIAVIASLAVCGLMCLAKGQLNHRIEAAVNLFDAIGLGVFVVIGVDAALPTDNWFLAITVGMLTGIGGGILRDIMAGQIPVVLRKHIYALAALAGSTIYYLATILDLPISLRVLFGSGITILLRMLATYFRWSLPSIRSKE